MTLPTTPGTYVLTFRANDSAPDGQAWYFDRTAELDRDGNWTVDGEPLGLEPVGCRKI